MISGTATLTPNGKHVSISRIHEISIFNICLGATLIDKIGEFRLSEEIEGGLEILKELNFIITIRYKIPTFSSVGPFFKEGGRGSRKFRPEAEILVIFSIEVAPYILDMRSEIRRPYLIKLKLPYSRV